jgi:threonine dehydrogenase-like Zn-dependent dehydrogenase
MIAVHLENGRVEIRKKPLPRRKDGFALIRVLAAGICNTDLELRRGYYGFRGTPGHEFTGEVVEAGTKALVGKRVAGEINLACGHCEYCRRNLGRHCLRRTVMGIVEHPGAFAEFVTLPEKNLHLVPRGLTPEQAVFIEPLAAACEILDQVRMGRGETAAVLGDGKLGLLIAQVLTARNIHVVHYGRHKEKLALSKAAGAETKIAGDKLPRGAYEYVVDATGSVRGLESAVHMTKPRGTVIMKSTVHGVVGIDAAPVIVNELTLVGSRCGRFEPAISLLRRGAVKVDEMIHARRKLSDAASAMDQAAERGVLKILLLPE